MAIAFDASSESGNTIGGTSLTWAHTCTGSNLLLFVGTIIDGNATEAISGVTYNGVAMTQLSKQQRNTDTGVWSYVYYLIAPATGANNIVVSTSASRNILWSIGASYTGALQSGVPDATATNALHAVTTASATVNVVASDCWLAGFGFADNGNTTISGDTGTTRETWQTGSSVFGDSNGTVTSGNKTVTINGNSNSNINVHGFSFRAAAAAGPANLKSLDTNVKANIKSYNTNALANIKSINTNA